MNASQILSLYDQEQRRDLDTAGYLREETANVVRNIATNGEVAFVIYSQLTPETADAAIREQIDYFNSRNLSFEWKYYQHDSPPDLPERLKAHGLEPEEPEAFLVLDMEKLPERLLQPITLDVRRLTDPEQVSDVSAVEGVVWQKDYTTMAERLAQDLRQRPDELCLYVAYEQHQPVSCAWIYFEGAGQFAGLWGGSTLPAYRQRGYYTALLAARVQEAARRGIRYLTVDASPMSRPILEKLGFQFLEYTIPYKWQVK